MPANYPAFFDPVKRTKAKIEDPTSRFARFFFESMQRARKLSAAGPPLPGSVIGSSLLPRTVDAFQGGLNQFADVFSTQPGGLSDKFGTSGDVVDRGANALFGSLRMAGSPLEAAFLSEIREPIVAGGETIGLDPAETGAQVDMVSIALPLMMMQMGTRVVAASNALARFFPEQKGALGSHPTSTPGRIINKTKEQGGFSVNLETGEIPSEGFMVSAFPLKERQVAKLTRKEVQEFARINRKVLEHPNNFLGTWVGPNGVTYLDVSRRIGPGRNARREAVKLGEAKRQLAIYDIGRMEEIIGGKWDDFIQSPEFHNRMNEMADIGQNYLKAHPTAEWWDLRGTTYDQIYGNTIGLEKVAGFNAATSPRSQLRENTQVATEYIRRQIAGEPVVQPGFKVPPGSLLNAGRGLPNEATRVNNLERVASGDIGALRLDKVNAMARAQIGDPNAAVFDTHWAKIAEKPSADIYIDSKPNIVPAGESYQMLHTEVAKAAKARGRTPRDFSADVWTGIRDQLARTGEAFGVQFGRRSGGESKGLADIFNDLIDEKAAKIGLTRKEMMFRLAQGDSNLLSWVISTPIGAIMFDQLYGGDSVINEDSKAAQNQIPGSDQL